MVEQLSNFWLDPVLCTIADILHSADEDAGDKLCYFHKKRPVLFKECCSNLQLTAGLRLPSYMGLGMLSGK